MKTEKPSNDNPLGYAILTVYFLFPDSTSEKPSSAFRTFASGKPAFSSSADSWEESLQP
jgi:hypothetical protein